MNKVAWNGSQSSLTGHSIDTYHSACIASRTRRWARSISSWCRLRRKKMPFATKPSLITSGHHCRPEFHVPVRSQVFDHLKSKPFVKSMCVAIEHEHHVP